MFYDYINHNGNQYLDKIYETIRRSKVPLDISWSDCPARLVSKLIDYVEINLEDLDAIERVINEILRESEIKDGNQKSNFSFASKLFLFFSSIT